MNLLFSDKILNTCCLLTCSNQNSLPSFFHNEYFAFHNNPSGLMIELTVYFVQDTKENIWSDTDGVARTRSE